MTLVFGVVLAAVTVFTWRVTAASGQREIDRLADQVQQLAKEREQLASQPKEPAPQERTSVPAQAPPEAAVYVFVRPGDTLSDISLAVYGTAQEWPKLAQANHFAKPWTIRPGDRLQIPNPPAAHGSQ